MLDGLPIPRMNNLDYGEGFAVEKFLDLAGRVWPREYSRDDAAPSLRRTINVGARDGTRLVGSVRVLTDGYFFATIPEILVDPAYPDEGSSGDVRLTGGSKSLSDDHAR